MKRTIQTIAMMSLMTFGLATLPSCGGEEETTTEENNDGHDHDGEDHDEDITNEDQPVRPRDPLLHMILGAVQVLRLLAFLRPELPNEPEEHDLGSKEPESDQHPHQ